MVIGENKPKILPVTFKEDNNAVIIIYGKSDGKTQANQREIPSVTALENSLFTVKRQARQIRIKKIVVSKIFFIVFLTLKVYEDLKKNMGYVKIFLWIYLI